MDKRTMYSQLIALTLLAVAAFAQAPAPFAIFAVSFEPQPLVDAHRGGVALAHIQRHRPQAQAQQLGGDGAADLRAKSASAAVPARVHVADGRHAFPFGQHMRAGRGHDSFAFANAVVNPVPQHTRIEEWRSLAGRVSVPM